MKHRQIITGMLLIAFGCTPAQASSAKASTKKASPKSHAKVAHKTKAKKHQAPALSKLALLQNRLPTAVSNAQHTASQHEAVLEKAPEIKGKVNVKVTPSTPATGVAAFTPGMTEAEQAKPKDRPEHPMNQIITGDSDNDFYIFGENQKIPEKLIANPDAQYAVVGGSEEKVARKVNAYRWASKQVASKVAKIKQLAALKAARENQALEAWRDTNLRVVYDESNPTNIDARMLSAGDRMRFYLDKVARRQHAPLPGSHLTLPDVASMPEMNTQQHNITILKPIGRIMVAELSSHGYDSKAVDNAMHRMIGTSQLAVNKPATVKFARYTSEPRAVAKPRQHVVVKHHKPVATPKQILAMKTTHKAPIAKAAPAAKPVHAPKSAIIAKPVIKKVVAQVKHPTEAELKLQKAEAKLAAYEAKLQAAAERMEAAEQRMQEQLKQQEARQLAAKQKFEEQRKAEEIKRLAAERKLEQERIAAAKLAEERQLAERHRLEQEKLAEAKRLAAKEKLEQKKREAAKRLAAKLKLQEQRKLEAAKKLAAKRKLEKQRKLEAEKRLAAKRKLEQQRLAAKRKLEAEKLAAAKRLAAKRKLEQEKLAAAKKLAAKRKLEAERKFAEEMKLAAQRKAEQKKLAARKVQQHKVAAAKPQTVHSIQKHLIDSRHQGAAAQAARTKPVAQPGYNRDIADLQQAMTQRQQRVAKSRASKRKAQQMADRRVDDQLMQELEEFRLAQDREEDF